MAINKKGNLSTKIYFYQQKIQFINNFGAVTDNSSKIDKFQRPPNEPPRSCLVSRARQVELSKPSQAQTRHSELAQSTLIEPGTARLFNAPALQLIITGQPS
jgi:hypothetical protein